MEDVNKGMHTRLDIIKSFDCIGSQRTFSSRNYNALTCLPIVEFDIWIWWPALAWSEGSCCLRLSFRSNEEDSSEAEDVDKLHGE